AVRATTFERSVRSVRSVEVDTEAPQTTGPVAGCPLQAIDGACTRSAKWPSLAGSVAQAAAAGLHRDHPLERRAVPVGLLNRVDPLELAPMTPQAPLQCAQTGVSHGSAAARGAVHSAPSPAAGRRESRPRRGCGAPAPRWRPPPPPGPGATAA